MIDKLQLKIGEITKDRQISKHKVMTLIMGHLGEIAENLLQENIGEVDSFAFGNTINELVYLGTKLGVNVDDSVISSFVSMSLKAEDGWSEDA